MISVLNNSERDIQLNALFYQPTYDCGRNCPGCYVKAHSKLNTDLNYPMNNKLIKDFFTEIYKRKRLKTNQFTISLDSLPPSDIKNKKIRDKLIAVYEILYDVQNTYTYGDKTAPKMELHATVHSIADFSPYITITGKALPLDMLSISNTTGSALALKLELYKPYIKHINYNHLVPWNISSDNINFHIEKTIDIAHYVDSIYLIMNKTPIGAPQSEIDKVNNIARMSTDIAYINTLIKAMPDSFKHKIHVDGCLTDLNKYRKTGFGCSSNVSRYQVWPDGSVTGCAYAFNGYTARAWSTRDILENIRKAKGTYEFRERCHLPETHKGVLQGLSRKLPIVS